MSGGLEFYGLTHMLPVLRALGAALAQWKVQCERRYNMTWELYYCSWGSMGVFLTNAQCRFGNESARQDNCKFGTYVQGFSV